MTEQAATRVVFLDDRRQKQLLIEPGTRVSAGVLRRQFMPDTVPDSERWRIDPGRGTSLDHIANAINAAQEGVMCDLTDLSTKAIDMDPNLGSLLGRRFDAIESCPWNVTPASGEGIDKAKAKRIADVIGRELKLLPSSSYGNVPATPCAGVEALISDLVWGEWDGRAANELVWKTKKPTDARPLSNVIDRILWVHPRRIHFGPRREPRLFDTYYRVQGFKEYGFDLTEVPGKFISYLPRLFREYPEREGLAIRCMYWAFFKRFSARERLILVELFGKPYKIVTVEKDAKVDEPTLDKLDEDVEALGPSTSLRLPKGATLEVPWPHPESGTIHQGVIDSANYELSCLLLGSPMTTDGQANRANGEVGERQQNLFKAKSGRRMSTCIRSGLIRHLVAFNAQDLELENEDEIEAYTPNFEIHTSGERDRNAEITRIKMVANDLGVEVCKDEVYEVAGLRKPAEDDETIGGPGVKPVLGPDGMPLPPGATPPPGKGPGEGGEPPKDGKQDPGEPKEPPPKGSEGEGRSDRDDEEDDEKKLTVHLSQTVRSEADLVLAQTAADRGATLFRRWTETILSAVDEKEQPGEIHAAIEGAHLKTDELRELLEEVDMRGAMLGALEAVEDERALDGVGESLLLDLGPRGGVAFVRTVFTEAVNFFLAKQVVEKHVWERMQADARLRAFTIAGLQRTSMLASAKGELERSILEGADLRDFSKRLKARFVSEGWTPLKPSHVETVFRNATMNAYSAGRTAQMTQPSVIARRPFWQWLAVTGDDRGRPSHVAAHKKVMSASDDAWGRIGPPAGHNCRCTRRSLTKEQAQSYDIVSGSDDVIRNLPDEGWRT